MIQAVQKFDRKKWLAERRKRLGATDISAILGINPWRTAYEVWLDKTGKLEDWSGNDATRLGTRLEPAILDEAEHRWGPIERNVVAFAEGLPIASTLDARIIESGEPIEAKTAGLLNEFAELGHWGEPGTDEIPDWYLVQCHTQIICTKAERCRMLALIAGRGMVEYEIPSDPKVAEVIANEAGGWWEKHITKGIEPSRENPPSIEIIKRIRREPESVTAIAGDDLSWFEVWEQRKAELKDAAKAEEEAKAHVLLSLGTSEAGQLPDGRMLTYCEQTRKGYTVKDSTFRVLRVKKGK